MESLSANVRRHFLSWDRPLLPQVVDWLAGNWIGEGPLDLSGLLVVVPTRQSGRRLREALAAFAATRSQAVFPPKVRLPEALLAASEKRDDVANLLESLLAWVEVLRTLPLAEFREVFPVDPPAQNFSWALRLAEDFVRLQHTLAESGLRAIDVPEKVGSEFPELARWDQIAALERMYGDRLAAAGLGDPQGVRLTCAKSPQLETGVERIVLLATPDPMPLALKALAAHARTVPIDIVIFARAEEGKAFDEWGRPAPENWASRLIEIADFNSCVHLCADPSAQADALATLAKQYAAPEGTLGVGIADQEVVPALTAALADADLTPFDPEGGRRAGEGFYQLLVSLAALARDDVFSTVETLVRCPDVLAYFKCKHGSTFSAAAFLSLIDQLHARHLPPTLAEARRHQPESVELALVGGLREMLRRGEFPANVTSALNEIFRDRRFKLADPADAATAESIEAWMDVVRQISAAAPLTKLTSADLWELALQIYGQQIRYDEKPKGAVELQGWLELLWEDAPHLVVAGLNDGKVPEAIVGHPFLPETLRERLGMKTNAARFARDAYILQAIVASRQGADANLPLQNRDRVKNSTASSPSDRERQIELFEYRESPVRPSGKIDLLVGKTSAAGDPLRPSRLLLRCSDAALPERIEFLFQASAGGRSAPAWRRAWTLSPRQAVVPEKIAVTAMRAWLACRFRFYLSRILRMEPVDPAKAELDAFDFGTLCHAALEAMGRAPAMRDCTDVPTLRDFLLTALDRAARDAFGAELTLPLLVQLESARQRLSRAAEVQAQARMDGWVIEWVEQAFEIEVSGLIVRGKIDRLERHEQDGRWRVIDYKTSDQPVDPWQAHLRPLRRGETVPDFAAVVVNGKEHVWSDLQLPLYLHALQTGRVSRESIVGGKVFAETEPPPALVCGYFNLPKAAAGTGIREWEDFTGDLRDAAWRCACGISAAIKNREFWPPNENVRAETDPFARLFHHGVAASVSWSETTVVVEEGQGGEVLNSAKAKETRP